MFIVRLILSPPFLGLVSLFVAVVWMLRDETDKVRPLVVFAIVINLSYGTLMTIAMRGEGWLLPWKYDLILLQIDHALGFSAAAIALPLVHGFWGTPLRVVYESVLPVMILFCFLQRQASGRAVVIRAYMAELVVGPLFYAILPGCGPIYAFGATWLHPAMETARTIRLSGFPNAFPSLHLATAFLFVLFARGFVWRGAATVFLVGTMLSTLSTGEHFVVDLVAGLVFGCFAGSVAEFKWRSAMLYLFTLGLWSVGIRLGYSVLLTHPLVLRLFALVTVLLAVHAVAVAWNLLPALSRDSPLGRDAVGDGPSGVSLPADS
jgi:hypothetical protein